MNELHGLGVYTIWDKILDTKERGIPHSRRRWHCVGILKDTDDGSFSCPTQIPGAGIELFLEKIENQPGPMGLPPSITTYSMSVALNECMLIALAARRMRI